MSWRKVRNGAAVVAATVTLGGWALWMTVRPWWKNWGVEPNEASMPLPGDDLIPGAPVSDTRGVDIDAAPDAIWPWLMQMGFGRAGWYSYDAIDMRGASADAILPEFGQLQPGDVVPTHPGGGFEVKVVEPGHALVLYSDTALMQAQAASVAGHADETPANLKAAGAFMTTAQPAQFAGSWAFVLEPGPTGGTRLIERFRARVDGEQKPWMKVTMPAMGFGVFVMMRKQMLGIRDRAESGANL